MGYIRTYKRIEIQGVGLLPETICEISIPGEGNLYPLEKVEGPKEVKLEGGATEFQIEITSKFSGKYLICVRPLKPEKEEVVR